MPNPSEGDRAQRTHAPTDPESVKRAHEWEQGLEAVRAMTRVAVVIFTEALAQGVSRTDAMALAVAYMRPTITPEPGT